MIMSRRVISGGIIRAGIALGFIVLHVPSEVGAGTTGNPWPNCR